MKRANLVLPLVLAFLLSAVFLAPIAAKAQVLSPARGGTGTSSTPSAGQVLVGQQNGTYAPQATSSLGITADLSGKSTSDLAEGSNLYYTLARLQSGLTSGYSAIFGNATATNATSTSLAVTGSFNFLGSTITDISSWFGGLFDTRLATKSTTDISEGSNLYFTNQRADDRIALQKGEAGGLATLDGAGKVPVSQLPNSIMEYQGTWNASTNSPTLADGTGATGNVYRVTVAGTQNLGSGAISFVVGDYAIYNGATWEKADTTDAVSSVNGLSGDVILGTDAIDEGSTNRYFTDARARAAISLTTTGTSGEATYDSSSGVLNVPQYADTTYTSTYPVTLSGTAFGLAFGTTTSNTWAGTQTFANAPVLGSLTGIVAGNSGALYAAATTTASCDGTVSCSAFTVLGSSPITITGSGGSGSISTSTALTSGQVVVATGAGTVGSFANLFWNSSNSRLGIGTATPLSELHINGGVGSLATGLTFGDGDTGFYENVDDDLYVSNAGTAYAVMTDVSWRSLTTRGWYLKNGAGSVTAPTYVFAGDNNTGFYSPSGDNVRLSIGGADAWTVTNTREFGIGTSSPFARLSVAGDAYVGGNLTATGTVKITPLATPAGAILAIDPAGSVIATTSPAAGMTGAVTTQTFTSSTTPTTTYTKPANLKWVMVKVVGGGGGGGGADASSSEAAGGGGGGAGGYCEKIIAAASIASTETVTVGGGGAGGSAGGGGNGGAGGPSAFGSHCTATGGAGGIGTGSSSSGGAGGTASNGTINSAGNGGQPGWSQDGTLTAQAGFGGAGGASVLGGAAQGNSGSASGGNAGSNYGGGGSGGHSLNGAGDAGGGGGTGGVFVYEYY